MMKAKSFAICLLIFFSYCVSTNLLAQTSGSTENEASQEKLISVSFSKGGNVGDYVKHLQQLDPTLDVIVTPSAAKIELPPIRIRKATAGEALMVIERCFDDHLEEETPISIESEFMESENPVFTVKTFIPPRTVTVLNIAHVFEGQTKESTQKRYDEFLTALETGLMMVDKNAGHLPEFKVHPETNLLFIKGSKEQIQTVQQIVEQVSFNDEDEQPKSR